MESEVKVTDCVTCGGKRWCLNSKGRGRSDTHPYIPRSACEFGRVNYLTVAEAMQVVLVYAVRALKREKLSIQQRAELENSIAAARRSFRMVGQRTAE